MNVAAALALQSLPFAGLVVAYHGKPDLFAVLYVAALGLLLSLAAITSGYIIDPALFGFSAGSPR